MSGLREREAARLFERAEDRAAFIEALENASAASPAIVWTCERPQSLPFALRPRLEWQPPWVDRLEADQRPGTHPLHESGAYYCLDFSSVFTAAVLGAITTSAKRALDLCAAPGGKLIQLLRYLSPERTIANEAIGKRTAPLIANARRLSLRQLQIVSRDPQFLAACYGSAFSTVVVDAPCSGQSLLAKGGKADGAFHPTLITKNLRRQRRILAAAADLVEPGGYLAYMTCSYSRKENEANVEWFLKHYPEFEAGQCQQLEAFQSTLSDVACYRLWPQQGLGAGGFSALLRKDSAAKHLPGNAERPVSLWASESASDV